MLVVDYSCVKRRSIYVEKVSETCYIDKSITTLAKLTHHLPTNDGDMTREVLAGTAFRTEDNYFVNLLGKFLKKRVVSMMLRTRQAQT